MFFDIVIYHNWCPDGIASAWCFWRNLHNSRNVQFLGYTFGISPPPVEGKKVIIVDFSFSREVLLEMSKVAKYILILDHHKSVERDLKDINSEASNVNCIFDMKRSAAQISWDYLYPYEERPWFIEVIADRDLWKWSLPYSKTVSKTMSVKGYYTFENLERLYSASINLYPFNYNKNFSIRDPNKNLSFRDPNSNIINEFDYIGKILIEQEEKDVSSTCSRALLTEFTTPKGQKYKVKLVNCPSNLRSEVGNRLANDYCDFVAIWNYDMLTDEWWISLRGSTTKNNIDLTLIASQFVRGGGHSNACGFAIKNSKGENLHSYFKIIEIPKSRLFDKKYIDDRNYQSEHFIESPKEDNIIGDLKGDNFIGDLKGDNFIGDLKGDKVILNDSILNLKIHENKISDAV